ncbi:MAG TPA: hypothetical protein VF364_09215 [Candidatus Limnocylindria bacterium]
MSEVAQLEGLQLTLEPCGPQVGGDGTCVHWSYAAGDERLHLGGLVSPSAQQRTQGIVGRELAVESAQLLAKPAALGKKGPERDDNAPVDVTLESVR